MPREHWLLELLSGHPSLSLSGRQQNPFPANPGVQGGGGVVVVLGVLVVVRSLSNGAHSIPWQQVDGTELIIPFHPKVFVTDKQSYYKIKENTFFDHCNICH